jgi:hypothetical protein
MSIISEERIEKLVREKMAGKSYSTIRDELSKSGMNPGEISALIRQVDEKVLGETTKQGDLDRAKQWYRFGLILALAGLILAIVYKAGIIFENLPAVALYSPFFAGILVMAYGKALQKKQSVPSEKGLGAIRKRRPFK